MVVKNVEKFYHIYLFENVLVCCKELPSTNKKRPEDTTFALKGNIYMKSVLQIKDTSSPENQVFELKVFWRESTNVETFVLQCLNQEQVALWKTRFENCFFKVKAAMRPNSTDALGIREGLMGPRSQSVNFSERQNVSVMRSSLHISAQRTSVGRSSTGSRNSGVDMGYSSTVTAPPSYLQQPEPTSPQANKRFQIPIGQRSSSAYHLNQNGQSSDTPNRPVVRENADHHMVERHSTRSQPPNSPLPIINPRKLSRRATNETGDSALAADALSDGSDFIISPSHDSNDSNRMMYTGSERRKNSASSMGSLPEGRLPPPIRLPSTPIPERTSASMNQDRVPPPTPTPTSTNTAPNLPLPLPPSILKSAPRALKLDTAVSQAPFAASLPSATHGHLKIKVFYKEDIFILSLPSDEYKLDTLIDKIARKLRIAGKLPNGHKLSLKYLDSDGDRVLLTCDEDITQALQESQNPLRLNLYAE